MKYILDNNGKPYRKYFEEICAIPHISYQEKALSDYIVEFAKSRGLWYYQDEIWNVIVKKPAYRGYESHLPVMIQGHIDMVGEKTPDSNFNFETDSLELYVENGFLKAKDTTLGADCGHGIAYMLAILDDTTLKHPAIEAVFTVQEEVGIGGSKSLDYSKLAAKRLIFTDSMKEGSPEISTTTVIGGMLKRKISFTNNDKPVFMISVEGLYGGHAAVNIIRDQANAIKVGARVVSEILKELNTEVKIVDIKGGTIKNNIPEICYIAFACEEKFDGIKKIVDRIANEIHEEHKVTDPNLNITLTEESLVDKAIDGPNSKDILEWLRLIPVGVQMRSLEVEGFPLTSRNLGTAECVGNQLILGYMFRSCIESHIQMLQDEMAIISEKFNAEFKEEYRYSGYTADEKGPLISLYGEVYKELTGGKEISPIHVHAGTDVGTIIERMGSDMDVVGIGPNTYNFHRPGESLDLDSFDRAYTYITKVLERL